MILLNILNDLLLTFNDIYFPFSLVSLLIITIVFYVIRTSLQTKMFLYKSLFFLLIFSFIFWSALLSLLQYKLWQDHPITKYVLPPYNPIDYFLDYAYFHFFRDFVYRLVAAAIIYLFIVLLTKIIQRDVFYDDERILMPLLSLIFIFPLNFVFILLGFFMLSLIIIGKVLMDLLLNNKSFLSNQQQMINKMLFSFRNYWLLNAWFLFVIQYLLTANYLLQK
ncbi:MAG: hypothetical protein KatS3mg097_174 [Candidatus Parcubacteria bacterium]|nr:MAG: hypothetical protein KatS3mg097_174 [Candidatus Parcubacteria bacterium]